MIKMAITYFGPWFKAIISITKLKPFTIFVGLGLTAWIEYLTINTMLDVPLIMILATVFSIIYNTITGAMASHHEALKCKIKGDNDCYERKKFEGKKLMFVIFKFITFFIWLFIAKATNNSFEDTNWTDLAFKGVTLFPVILFLLYEFISANKNVKRRYGKYPKIIDPIIQIYDYIGRYFNNLMNSNKNIK